MTFGNKPLEGGHAASHSEHDVLPILAAPATKGELNRIRMELIPVACWKLEDLRFDFDSSFVVPAAKPEFAELRELRKARPGAPLSLFGHADPTGDETYNKTLSGHRAEAVYAVLIHDVARWEKLYTNAHGGDQRGLRQVQLMLQALGFDPGATTGAASTANTQAIKDYQKSKGLSDDGSAGPQTRSKLFADYMALLWPVPLAKTDFLSQGADPGGKGDFQGCSEFNPVMIFSSAENTQLQKPANHAQRNADNVVNRRVMALLFRPGSQVPPAKWPCPRASEGTAGCKKRFWSDSASRLSNQADRREFKDTKDTFGCRFYHRLVETSPCEGVLPVLLPNTITLALDSPHFIPDIEELKISYTIGGPLSQVVKVTAVITMQRDPKTVVVQIELPAPYAATGDFHWKGDMVSDPDMKGWLSLLKSPYDVKLVLTNTLGAGIASNILKLEILPHSVTIQVDTIPAAGLSARDKKAVKGMKPDTDANKKGELVLDSAIFKVNSAEMTDDSSFVEFETAWQKGPRVPLFANVLLKAKDGSGKRALKALTGVKLLWDVLLSADAEETAELDARAVHTAAKTFITKANAFEKDTTVPKGRTGYLTLGGQRAKSADRPANQQWSQLNAAWSQSTPTTRIWDAHTACAELAGTDYDSGVVFVGGRLGGDTHKVSAYLNHDLTLDVADDTKLTGATAERKSNEFSYTNWRRIAVRNNYFIDAATTPLQLSDLDAYHEAAVRFEAPAGFVAEEIRVRWKAAYQKAVNKLGANDEFVKLACLPDPGLFPVSYETHAAYLAKVDADTNVFGRLINRIRRFFGAESEDDYKNECDNQAFRIYTTAAKEFPLQANGITFFRWRTFGAHNQVGSVATVGIAPSIDGYTNRNKTAFFVFNSTTNANTFIHEVGHQVFLAHAPGHFSNTSNDPANTSGTQPAGFQSKAHDELEFCVMSYHKTKPVVLCGLCQLKVRGWDPSKITRKAVVSP